MISEEIFRVIILFFSQTILAGVHYRGEAFVLASSPHVFHVNLGSTYDL